MLKSIAGLFPRISPLKVVETAPILLHLTTFFPRSEHAPVFMFSVFANNVRLLPKGWHLPRGWSSQTADDGKKKLVKVAIEIMLPPDFPEKYRNAIVKTAGLCSVKKVILDPPEFEITAI
jgi:hypothetical protein